MNNLTENLFHAWAQRGRKALAEAAAINRAPALFTRERQEQVAADFRKAQQETERWSS